MDMREIEVMGVDAAHEYLPAANSDEQPQPKKKKMMLIQAAMQKLIGTMDDRGRGIRDWQDSCFKSVDDAFPGWCRDGDYIVVAARPGVGKTSFGHQIAESIAQKNKTVLFFSLEMSAERLAARSLSRMTGVDLTKMKMGTLNTDEWDKIAAAIPSYSNMPLLINEGGVSIADIEKNVRKVKESLAEAGLPQLGCVLIDYIQKIQSNEKDSIAAMKNISTRLLDLARETNVPFIVLAQLNRGVESRVNKRPGASDLKESGQIEQDADTIMMLYRDELYNPETDQKGMAELLVVKNRDGCQGTVKLRFSGERAEFGDMYVEF